MMYRVISFLEKHRIQKHFSVWLIALALCPRALAQNTNDIWKNLPSKEITLIEINEGLSQGMINHVCEDKDGYLWITTKDGLNRYDGVEFKVFMHDQKSPTSIANNFTFGLHIDQKNRVWVGTQSSGVDLYDPQTETFVHFNSENKSGEGLTSNFIGEIYEDHAGNILVETLDTNGYNVIMMSEYGDGYPLANEVLIKPIREVYPVMSKINKSKHFSKHLHFDAYGGLWYLQNDTIHYCSQDDLSANADPVVYCLQTKPKLDPRDETYLLFSSDKRRVFGTDGHHTLYEYDFEQEKFIELLKTPKKCSFRNSQFLDSSDRIWSWEKDGKGFRIDLSDMSVTELKPNWNQLKMNSRNIHTGIILEDLNNNLWMGTGGNGLLKISLQAERFRRPLSSSDSFIGSIRTFRTEKRGGESMYDPEIIGQMKKFIREVEGNQNGLSSDWEMSHTLSSLCLDAAGNFWGTGYNKKRDMVSLIHFNPDQDNEYNIVSENGYVTEEMYGTPIFLDHNDGVWFGDRYNEGVATLYHYDSQSNSIIEFPFPGKASKFQYRFISDMFFDGDDLWMATMNGVYRFNISDHSWVRFEHTNEKTNSLSSNQTLALCPDPHDPETFIWVGTEGGGLNRLNKHTGESQVFTSETGLPNDVVYAIQPDFKGNIWFGTNQGLCLFNTSTFKCKTYKSADGLPSNEFNRYEYSKDDQGLLYFGGMGGLVAFDPHDFYETKPPSRTVISYVMLFNEPVGVRDEAIRSKYGFELLEPIERSDELKFSYTHDMITFGFAHLNLSAPDNNYFRFRLEGLNSDWIDMGNRNEVTFTDLSPGDYKLFVVGASSDLVYNSEPTMLSFTVSAPWYARWWALLIGMSLLVFGLYTAYRIRVNNLLKFERMRNRIAQDLHDEIGSTLSSISLYSAALVKSNESLPDSANEILEKIDASAVEIMDSMNDIVWTIKAENDNFLEVLNRVRSFGSNVAEAKGLSFDMIISPSVKGLKLKMDIRKELYLMLKELIINAVKHAQCRWIRITVEYTNQILLIDVEDDGIGLVQIDNTQPKSTLGGNGIVGVKFRAKEIGAQVNFTGESGKGTHVRIMCPVH